MKPGGHSPVRPVEGSLLVYAPSGLLRLYCPIPARCILPVGPHRAGERVAIEGISHSRDDPLLYLIRGRLYGHRHFTILTPKR